MRVVVPLKGGRGEVVSGDGMEWMRREGKGRGLHEFEDFVHAFRVDLAQLRGYLAVVD